MRKIFFLLYFFSFLFSQKFTFELKEIKLEKFLFDGKTYDFIYVPNLNYQYLPSLPSYEEFIFLENDSGQIEILDYLYEIKENIFLKEENFNKELIKLEYLGKREDKNLFKITIHPFQYEKDKKILKIYKKIDYRIKEFKKIKRDTLLSLKELPNRDLIKIEICSTGIYEITYEDLKKIVPNIDLLNPEYFSLYDANFKEIPILIFGEEDGRFDKKDKIIFFGKEHFSLYTLNNVYWLSLFNLNKGKRMKKYLVSKEKEKSINFALESLKIEYDNFCPARSGILWVWEEISKPEGIQKLRKEYKLDFLNNPIVLKKLFLRFWPKKGNINLYIYLNDVLIDSLKFIGQPNYPQVKDFLKEKEILLKNKNNLLVLELIGEREMSFYFDFLEIEYKKELIFDNQPIFFTIDTLGKIAIEIKNKSKEKEIYLFNITKKEEPKLIENFYQDTSLIFFSQSFFEKTQFYLLSEKNFKKPLNVQRKNLGKLKETYDYIIITPKELYSSALLLKSYRQKTTNLKIGIALLEDIYDEYAGGLREISAIKEFLKEKRPKYSLFLGDANYDYRGILKKFGGVPTYEWGYDYEPGAYSDRGLCFDSYFADLEGNGTSPDIILTRLPIRNEEEMKTFLRKLEEYEKNQFIFSNKILLLLADDEYNGNPSPDKRDPIWRDHYGSCEHIGNLSNNQYLLKKIYLFDYPFLKSNDKGDAKADLIKYLNKGVGILCYFGHGAGDRLAHENIFSLSDIYQLENKGKYFFAFFASCGVGRFDETEYECLAEELVRSPYGAIATVAGSKATSTISNKYFGEIMFNSIFSQSCSTFGEAFFRAWYMDKKYHFFGEPLTKIPFFPLKRNNLQTNETIITGKIFLIKDTISEKDAQAIIFASLPKRRRIYNSWFGQIFYDLPQDFFYLNYHKIKENKIIDSFFVTQIPYPDTIYLTDGLSYFLNPSANIYLTIKGEKNYSLSSPPLFFKRDTSNIKSEVSWELFADNKLLKETTEVNRNFILKGKIYSKTGLLQLPYFQGCGFYLTPYQTFFDLLPYLSYQPNSYTNLTFSLPISLVNDTATLIFYLTDNLLNRFSKTYFLKVYEKDEIKDFCFLKINENTYCFSFNTNKIFEIKIKIYTLNGKLIKELKTLTKIGNNTIYWDKKDFIGNEISRGIYLTKVIYNLNGKEETFLRKIIIE
ncbi:MAG: C25 family cysteine peptidase [candidate division WOR-3 bacterium]|nr:C25 family cysteine peptidase [candidate division WOR-3 bacterium]